MIVKLNPSLKSYLWGGTNLKSQWNKVSTEQTLSESWELSCHDDGPSEIVCGKYDGKLLKDVITDKDLGANCRNFKFFPVLNKIIDASKPLSIQVHPSDEYALEHENQFGKTEMWYILSAEEGAFLYLGLNCDMTADQFAEAVENKTICDYLNKVYVHSGETYFIPSGTIHAIGSGITLYEVQQNSSLTYRVYDFDRVDANGNKRQLHVDKAKKVVNLNKYDVPDPARQQLLGKCKYFALYRYQGNNEFCYPNSFSAITVLDGQVDINGLKLIKGETAFVSAGERIVVSGGTYALTTVE